MNISNRYLSATLALVLLAVIFAYTPALSGPFQLDDTANIPQVQIDRLTKDEVTRVILSGDSGPTGRPVSTISLALTSLWDKSPFAYKYHNLLIHLLCCLAVLVMASKLFAISRGKIHCSPTDWALGLAATALWALHPLQVSTVAYAVQRMTMLSALFSFVAIIVFLHARMRPRELSIAAQLGYVSVIGIACIFATLSKENGALTPLYLLLIDRFLIAKNYSTVHGLLRGLGSVVPSVLVVAAFLYMVPAWLDGYAARSFSVHDRLLIQPYAVTQYIKWLLAPNLSELGLFHDGIAHNASIYAKAGAILCLSIGLIGLLVLRKRIQLLTVGGLVFLTSHLIESTLVPLELAFEHRNYFGSALLIVGVVAAGAWLQGAAPRTRTPLAALGVVLLAIFTGLTMVRAEAWSSEARFLDAQMRNHPQSSRMHSYVGNFYLQYRDIEKARSHYRKAQALDQNNGGATLHLILTHCRDQVVPSTLVDAAVERLQLGTPSAYALGGIQSLVSLSQNDKCPGLSTDHLVQLAAALSNNSDASKRYAYHSHVLLGRAHRHAGDLSEATATYREATQYVSSVAAAHRHMVYSELLLVAVDMGKISEAIEAWCEIQRIDKAHGLKKHMELDLHIELDRESTKLNEILPVGCEIPTSIRAATRQNILSST